jgi:xylulokinase
MYGAIGTGNFETGIVTISLGTSGTAYTFLGEPFIDPTGEIGAFRDSTGHHLPLLCVSNMANGYDALRSQYDLSHEEFDTVVENTPLGNRGRILLPWYMGERTPDVPLAAPLYFGFQVSDFEPPLLCRAALEGHVLNLFDGFARMPVTPREIRLTGGLARSASWSQTIADVFQAETVPVEGEGAALGAAIHAAWVWEKELVQPVGGGKEQARPEGGGRKRAQPAGGGEGAGIGPGPPAGLLGEDLSVLKETAEPFVVLDEARRKVPSPGSRPAVLLLRRLFQALSRRVRGEEGEDPFHLRQKLSDLTEG